MSAMKNTINGEFVEGVVKNNSVSGYKGLIVVAAASGLAYVIGNRQGFERGVKSHSRVLRTYLEGMLAGVDIGEKKDNQTEEA